MVSFHSCTAQRKEGRVYNSLPYYGSNGGILADSQEVYWELESFYNAMASEQATMASTIVGNPFAQQEVEALFIII